MVCAWSDCYGLVWLVACSFLSGAGAGDLEERESCRERLGREAERGTVVYT